MGPTGTSPIVIEPMHAENRGCAASAQREPWGHEGLPADRVAASRREPHARAGLGDESRTSPASPSRSRAREAADDQEDAEHGAKPHGDGPTASGEPRAHARCTSPTVRSGAMTRRHLVISAIRNLILLTASTSALSPRV